MREAIAKAVAGTIFTCVFLPTVLQMIDTDPWVTLIISGVTTIGVLVWGFAPKARVRTIAITLTALIAILSITQGIGLFYIRQYQRVLQEKADEDVAAYERIRKEVEQMSDEELNERLRQYQSK